MPLAEPVSRRSKRINSTSNRHKVHLDSIYLKLIWNQSISLSRFEHIGPIRNENHMDLRLSARFVKENEDPEPHFIFALSFVRRR